MSRIIPPMRIFSTESTAVSGTVSQTVNVNVPSSLPKYPDVENVYGDLKTRDLHLPNPSKEVVVLEQILQAYMNNPLVINRFIIMTTKLLANLIKDMCDADEVEVHVLEDVTCCGYTTNYNLIDAIIVAKNNIRTDFSVAFNEFSTKLNDYRISLKYTTDN
jgi:hypothetical protein